VERGDDFTGLHALALVDEDFHHARSDLGRDGSLAPRDDIARGIEYRAVDGGHGLRGSSDCHFDEHGFLAAYAPPGDTRCKQRGKTEARHEPAAGTVAAQGFLALDAQLVDETAGVV